MTELELQEKLKADYFAFLDNAKSTKSKREFEVEHAKAVLVREYLIMINSKFAKL